jgi:hypothetical protein
MHGALKVDELELQALQLFSLSRDLATLLLERRGQCGVHHLAFEEAIDHLSRLRRGEP